MIESNKMDEFKNQSFEKGLVSIIIPIYNGNEHIEELIKSIKNQTYKKIEIIAIDNNSNDDSLKTLKKINEDMPIVIFSNEINRGYCGGCNKGIEIAKGEYLLFLSQDRLMKNDWIEKAILKIKENFDVGCVIGKVERENASSPEYGHSYDIYGAVIINGEPNESKLFFGGGTVIITKEVIDKIGGFDPEFFIYQEDVDICWRIRLAGYKIKIEKNAICENMGGGISDTFHDSKKTQIKFDDELIKMKPYKFYFSQKNRIRTLLKNYSTINIWKRVPIALAMIMLRSIYMSIKNKNKKYFFDALRGFAWNIIKLRNTVKARRIIQKNRVVDDDEIEKHMEKESIELKAMRLLRNNAN